MSLTRNARPNPANIRTRLYRLHESAQNGGELARRWKPRGHSFPRDEVIGLFDYVERESARLLRRMKR